jgi:hypothetical protein
MTLNPQDGLLGLIAAVKSGMDPSSAFGVVQYLQQQQAQNMARRQERLSGLSDLLQNAAGTGTSYEDAQILAQAQPGPMGPAARSMLNTYYPTADIQPGSQQAIDYVQSHGSQVSPQSDVPSYAPGVSPEFGPTAQSPIYNGPSVEEQTAQMQLQSAQADAMASQQAAMNEPGWAVFQQSMAAAKAKGIDPTTAYSTFVQHNGADGAMLVASDPARAKGIMQATFGAAAVNYAGATPQG